MAMTYDSIASIFLYLLLKNNGNLTAKFLLTIQYIIVNFVTDIKFFMLISSLLVISINETYH